MGCSLPPRRHFTFREVFDGEFAPSNRFTFCLFVDIVMNLILCDPVRYLMTHCLLILGFVAQGLFFCRFLIQWIASEKERRSVLPVVFWYFSIVGGTLLLIYAILEKGPGLHPWAGRGAFDIHKKSISHIQRTLQAEGLTSNGFN